MRISLHDRIRAQRQQREALGRVRVRRLVSRRDGVRAEVDGRWLTNFCSNDYLGLSQQFAVTEALQSTAAREGAGGIASHLVCGHHATHEALEREVADWLGYPRALLFGSGFLANLAVMQALLRDGDLCVQDKLNHASLLDAARLSGCTLRRYPHADADAALRQRRSLPEPAAMLASDGVFSMDGDLAPLRELALLARAHDALAALDEWNAETTEAAVRSVAEAEGVKLGALAQPLRAALTGRKTSPGIFDVLDLLGRDESLGRVGDRMAPAD
jgi:8-amino-7-oxononanoate synthase